MMYLVVKTWMIRRLLSINLAKFTISVMLASSMKRSRGASYHFEHSACRSRPQPPAPTGVKDMRLIDTLSIRKTRLGRRANQIRKWTGFLFYSREPMLARYISCRSRERECTRLLAEGGSISKSHVSFRKEYD
jgi:hypothetical protein